MKLTFIMIMGFTRIICRRKSPNGRINFKADRIPAEMVIQQLKALTHYRFLLQSRRNQTITGKTDGFEGCHDRRSPASISCRVETGLHDWRRRDYHFTEIKKPTAQQVKEIKITGKVRGEQGQELPGATIQIKGPKAEQQPQWTGHTAFRFPPASVKTLS